MNRTAFFDSLADTWDSLHPPELQHHAVERGLDLLALAPDARLLDVACGTGIVLDHVRKRLGPQGRAVGLDISTGMVRVAASKFKGDARVSVVHADFLSYESPPFDAIAQYNSLPHFADKAAVARKVHSLLAPAGLYLVWHDKNRLALAELHHRASPAVARDVLPDPQQLADLFAENGFVPLLAEEDEGYRVLVRRGYD